MAWQHIKTSHSPSTRSIPHRTIRSFANRSDCLKAVSRVWTLIDAYFNQRCEIKRPPVSSLNVPMLFYDMAGSEVTYSAKCASAPLMLSYRQEDWKILATLFAIIRVLTLYSLQSALWFFLRTSRTTNLVSDLGLSWLGASKRRGAFRRFAALRRFQAL